MYRTPETPPRARLPLLDQVTVKTPCRESWDAMAGDERVRFCTRCSKNVYDLSAMTQDEAESFLAANLDDENPCIRLYRRPDGRVLTSECVQGTRTRHARKAAAGMAAGLCVVALGSVALASVHVPDGRNLPRSHARIDVKRLAAASFGHATAVPDVAGDPAAAPDVLMGRAPTTGFSMGEGSFVENPPPFRPLPIIKELGADVSAGLPEQVVRRVVRQNFGRTRLCYENRLAEKPDLDGKVVVQFFIGRDGSVLAAKDGGSDLGDPQAIACIVRGFANLSFPQPEPRGLVSVSYRMVLHPRP